MGITNRRRPRITTVILRRTIILRRRLHLQDTTMAGPLLLMLTGTTIRRGTTPLTPGNIRALRQIQAWAARLRARTKVAACPPLS